MKLINGFTSDANQKMTITMDDGSLCNLNISYWDNQKGWYYNFTHPLLVQGWRRIVCSPNLLRQFRNVINFGFYVNTTDGLEPIYQTDFTNGRAFFFVLNKNDVAAVEANIIG